MMSATVAPGFSSVNFSQVEPSTLVAATMPLPRR